LAIDQLNRLVQMKVDTGLNAATRTFVPMQLKQDATNGISNINWTVYGKIDTVVNGTGTISYTYDVAGNASPTQSAAPTPSTSATRRAISWPSIRNPAATVRPYQALSPAARSLTN
jgi:hypothetical protein